MASADFIAIDWGTTNRRIYLIDGGGGNGAVLRTERDDKGVTALTRDQFPGEIAAIRARFGDYPVLCAGMVGSTRGWVEAPYIDCPAGLPALAAALCRPAPDVAIVPGMAIRDGDVMRGEEVQLLGAVAAGLVPADSLLCQPGTHCKWARMADGAVADFRTTMTGEIFAMLRQHSLLGDFLTGSVTDGPAFRDGVEAARRGRLLSDLFGARAGVLLGVRTIADTPSYVSGLMIGSDIREQGMAAGDTTFLLADRGLGDLYGAALSTVGIEWELVDSQAAFVAGIAAIRRIERESH